MFNIDVMSRVPAYEQIINQVEELVLKKLLPAQSKLPSVRGLSAQLSINPNTIQKAYTELERRGVIVTVPGKGAFIAEAALTRVSDKEQEKLSEFEDRVRQLKLAGVEGTILINIISEIYGAFEEAREGEKND